MKKILLLATFISLSVSAQSQQRKTEKTELRSSLIKKQIAIIKNVKLAAKVKNHKFLAKK